MAVFEILYFSSLSKLRFFHESHNFCNAVFDFVAMSRKFLLLWLEKL